MTDKAKTSISQTQKFLLDKFGSGISNVQSLGEGGWSEAYSFSNNGEKMVIRWGDVPDNFNRDARAAKFASDKLPIPPILFSGKDDRFYAISPFVSGSFLEEISATDLSRLATPLTDTVRAIRTIDITDTTGFGVWDGEGKGMLDSWKDALLENGDTSPGSLIHGWRAKLEASEMGAHDYDKLWSMYEPLVSNCPEERQMVHSDFLNKNVLTANGKITAVLDWGSSFYGDSLYEIAWFSYCVFWYPQFTEVNLINRLLDDYRNDPATNKENIEERLKCYLLNIGLGSIAYNAYKGYWKVAKDVTEYTFSLAR